MPPQNYSPNPQFSLVLTSPPQLKTKTGWKYSQAMGIANKKSIAALVTVLITISLLRLLWITIRTSTTTPIASMPPALLYACSSPRACNKSTQHRKSPLTSQSPSISNASALTDKEYHFLSHLISHRAPCNILIFGLQHHYLAVASLLNAGGTTIFLEDTPAKLGNEKTHSKNIQVKEVRYKTYAKEAYKLLKHARTNPGCAPNSGLHDMPRCKLALTELPEEVYKTNWDVVIVDGPSGEGPELPGRMAAIYTASILARTGNMTNVMVHDVDRMIEKWFSWEFLCDENLVSSKGRFWNFRIAKGVNSTRFCTA
ncbi:glucuronoxylan 4-O-methyltransferase 1 [Heracleum sosnowskyi]|uniref:Glucuronoxylan 4-O-methyltransferase 1 n=1 Tax=Heracleum sosnowskyi TaxID=360622 RepID=A0AAD8I3P7_9APIA|nr:glucuronoxylan 4-O-methyltransferase 1 [Heracleum sosnowskyi]